MAAKKDPAKLHTAAGQEQLFAIRRDWTRLLPRLQGRNTAELVLTGTAAWVVEDFSRVLNERQSPSRNSNIRTLSILVYWCGADAAISERDVHDLARTGPDLTAKTVCPFLRDRGILLQDSDLHRDVDLTWIDITLAALPEILADEVGQWVKVLRSRERHEGEVRGYDAIRPYLASLQPVLTAWAEDDVLSLREITRHHVDAAVDSYSGRARRQLALALRSLFRTLKWERVAFRDPAQRLRVGNPTGIPKACSQRPAGQRLAADEDPARASGPRPGRSPRRAPPRTPHDPDRRPGSRTRHPRHPPRPSTAHPLPGGTHSPDTAAGPPRPTPACSSARDRRSTPTTPPSVRPCSVSTCRQASPWCACARTAFSMKQQKQRTPSG
ncbi:hypothetical protein [Streptomyces sp. NPDC060010]|uniref:hypothetical protein n=1 Tax=Streptomyces sp. NPDC060010 TaxID=3347036 RepID=UPI00368CCE9D